MILLFVDWLEMESCSERAEIIFSKCWSLFWMWWRSRRHSSCMGKGFFGGIIFIYGFL